MGCTTSTTNGNQTKDKEENTPREKVPDLKKESTTLGHEDQEEFTYFQNVALFAHNHYRQEHWSPPLKLNKDLCELAEQLAKRMARSEQLDQSLSETRVYQGHVCGENLYWREDDGLPVVGDTVVKHWYSEGESYDYENPGYNEKTAHFTQMIWSGCKEMGIASATSNTGASAVAVYYPAGNTDGKYEDNVKPKTAKS